MKATPIIHDLVREGRASPRDGAMLIELRRDMASRRERKLRQQSPFVRAVVALGVIVLALLGVRRYS